MGGGIATCGDRGEEGDLGAGPGTVKVEELFVDVVPLVVRRVGDGGARVEAELEEALGDDVASRVEEVVRVIDALGPVLEPLSPVFSLLVTLRDSIVTSSESSASSPLLNEAHAHSSEINAESNDFALQPAPTPSTACFGLSCFLNNSQFAYTHLSSQYMVTKSASSTIIV